MNNDFKSDLVIVISVATALFYSWALIGLFAALLIRDNVSLTKIQAPYFIFFAALLWALMIFIIRGLPKQALLLQFLYFSLLPFFILIYKPTTRTIDRYNVLVLILFSLDLLFNVIGYFYGGDLLGRSLDARDALFGVRYGGLFAHSFYSGSITTIAAIVFLSNKRWRYYYLLAIVNFLLGGSWRFIALIFLLPILSLGWRRRKRIYEILIIITISAVMIIATYLTAVAAPKGFEENSANRLRLIAWTIALDKIGFSPLTGVGYPSIDIDELEGINIDKIDELQIAESWYLDTAMTYGLPYTLLVLCGFLIAFYGPGYHFRSQQCAVMFPLILIDSTYGEFWGSILVYTWLWLLVGNLIHTSKSSVSITAN